MPEAIALESLGYSDRWRALFAPHASEGLTPARVVRADRGSALVATEAGIVRAEPSPHLLKAAAGPADLPAAGDWVALHAPSELDVPLIEAVLARASAVTRGDPGKTSDAQVLAANVDVVFVVHPIAEAPNLRRIERELTLAWDSGALPVVILTKADLSADPEDAVSEVRSIAPGVEVIAVNALSGDGITPLVGHVAGDRTAVMIGPSGAGKSTLINAVLGEQRQATREVRTSDGRGRHTTVARELVRMPGGGILIDTPGLRALGLTGSLEGITASFPDIGELADSCRFRDCTHISEPGCAVIAAAESGILSRDRLDSYRKLVRESQVVAAKTDARLRAEEERRSKSISKASKEYFKHLGRH